MSRHEELKARIRQQLDAMSPEQKKRWMEQALNDPAFRQWLCQGLKNQRFK